MPLRGKDRAVCCRVASATLAIAPRQRVRRTLAALAVITLGLGSVAAHAQSVIFQENFNNGLGRFTAVGSVSTTAGNALIRGSLNGTDGAITSAQFSTAGFSSLSLSFDRTTSGLDLGEAGIA